MRRLDRVLIWAVPTLLAVLIILSVVYAAKKGIASLDWLKSNKDALAAINSIIATSVLLVGGVVGYLRFFRGRTLTTRVELSIDADVVESPESEFLHSVTVSVKNIGTIAILSPRPYIQATAWRADKSLASELVECKWQDTVADELNQYKFLKKYRFFGIDSGETADFCHEQFFPADVWAVSYVASIASGDSTWAKRKLVESGVRNSTDTADKPFTTENERRNWRTIMRCFWHER